MLRQLIRFRNWAFFAGFVAIFGGVIVCSFLFAISYPPFPGDGPVVKRDYSDSAAQQQPTNNPQSGPKNVPTPVAAISSAERDADARGNERDRLEKAANERGLTVATWILAFATLLLFAAAISQIVLFFWQLKLISKSLVDAKESADAAKGAAGAAERQAKAAENSLKVLERPWIFVRLHPFLKDNPADAPTPLLAADDGVVGADLYPVAADPPDRIPLAIFDISNHGRMPGIITDCHILLEPVEVTAQGLQIGVGFIRDDVHGPVGPSETRADLSVDCPGGIEYGVIVDIVTGVSRPVPTRTQKHIFVFRIVIAYLDVARDRHVSSFCWRFDDGMGYWVQHGEDEYNYQT